MASECTLSAINMTNDDQINPIFVSRGSLNICIVHLWVYLVQYLMIYKLLFILFLNLLIHFDFQLFLFNFFLNFFFLFFLLLLNFLLYLNFDTFFILLFQLICISILVIFEYDYLVSAINLWLIYLYHFNLKSKFILLVPMLLDLETRQKSISLLLHLLDSLI